MTLLFDMTDDDFNTNYAPIVALAHVYQQEQILAPFQQIKLRYSRTIHSIESQLTQLLLSIFAGCEYVSMVNTKLRPERKFAQLYRIDQFAHQSSLARTLDGLTQMNLEQLREAVYQIGRVYSRTLCHDWRGHLQLDFDLSGLPCSKAAEGSRKGYFAEKKRHRSSISAYKCA